MRHPEVVTGILGINELLKWVVMEEEDQKTLGRVPSLDWNWGLELGSSSKFS